MWRDAAEGETQWEDEGGGIYQLLTTSPRLTVPSMALFFVTGWRKNFVQAGSPSTWSRFAIDMKIDAVNLPPMDSRTITALMAVNRRYPTGRVLVRLPGNANPNGRRVLLSSASRNEFGNEETHGGHIPISFSMVFNVKAPAVSYRC